MKFKLILLLRERTRIIVRRPPILLLYFMTSDHLEPHKSKGSLSLKDSQQSHFFYNSPRYLFLFLVLCQILFIRLNYFLFLIHSYKMVHGFVLFFPPRLQLPPAKLQPIILGIKCFNLLTYTRQVPKIPLNKRKLTPNLH